MVSPKLFEFWQLNEDFTTPDVVWEACKAATRGKYISSIKTLRSDFASQATQLEQRESEASVAFADDPTPELFSSLLQIRRELKLQYTLLV